jgi:DNA modification methylase
LNTDYASLPPYDLVFTSPPYYFIQKYPHNVGYANKDEMDEKLYRPLFSRTFEHLQPGGHYVLNVSGEVYERVCVPLWGRAHEETIYRKSKRQNQYQERVFIWRK